MKRKTVVKFPRVLFAASLLLIAALPTSCKFERPGKGDGTVEEAPIYVHAEYPMIRPMEEVIEVHGNLEPVEQVDVVSEVSGTAIKVLAEEGDSVTPGQLLARIDDEEYRLSLRQSQSAYTVARSDYLSASQLYKEGMKARSDYEKAKRSYDDARANLQLSKIKLKNTEIRSPIKGVVIGRSVELYQQVGAMEVLFTVADLSGFKIPITVTEAEVAKLDLDQKVRIRIDALAMDPDSFPVVGSVTKIQPRVDPQTGTVQVEVNVPEPGRKARPGMFARLKIVTAVHPDAMVIPRRALAAEDGYHVWAVSGTRARLVEIKTGLIDEKGIEILEGLTLNDLVIVDGQAALTPKSNIQIVNEVSETSPADSPEPKQQ